MSTLEAVLEDSDVQFAVSPSWVPVALRTSRLQARLSSGTGTPEEPTPISWFNMPATAASPSGSSTDSVALVVISPDGRKLVELPIGLRSSAPVGSRLSVEGQDVSGSLTVTLSLNPSESSTTVNLRWNARETLPSAMLPTIRLLKHLVAPNQFSLFAEGIKLVGPKEIPLGTDHAFYQLADLVEKLEYVQRETDTYFNLPAEFSVEDISALRRAERLLRGDKVLGTWTSMSVNLTLSEGFEVPRPGFGESAFMAEANEQVTIAGHSIVLGPSVRHMLAAQITSWTPGEKESTGRLELHSVGASEFETWLPRRQEKEYAPVPGISHEFRELLGEFVSANDEVLRRLAQ